PEKAEIGWELAQAIEGISLAAESLRIPVVSGNVSLYNETGGRAIPPTPVVGCVGLVRDVTRIPSRWQRGDRVLLLRGFGHGLVAFVWRHAQLVSLAPDLSDRGVELALPGAAAQPLVHHGRTRAVALGHNGNLVNAHELRQELGKPLASTSDSEVIAALIASDERPLEEAVPAAMGRLEGAATVVGLADGRLF